MQSIIGFFNTLGDFFENFSASITESINVLVRLLSVLPPLYTTAFLAVVGILVVYALLGRG